MEPTDQQSLQQWLAQDLDDDDDQDDLIDTGELHAETVVAMLLLLCKPSDSGKVSWRSSVRKLAVMASHILPDIGRDPLTKIAGQLTRAGIPTTRASLSHLNVKLAEATGFRRTEKTDRAREIYRKRALETWEERRKTVDSQHDRPA